MSKNKNVPLSHVELIHQTIMTTDKSGSSDHRHRAACNVDTYVVTARLRPSVEIVD